MGKIRRLTTDEWLEARQSWEADMTLTFDAMSDKLGVSKQAISKMAKKQGWVKSGSLDSINRAAQIRADAAEVDGKVDQSTGKRLLPGSIDQSTDLRSKLIQSHRAEWRKHAGMFTLEKIGEDYKKHGTAGKISAEMLAIRQKAERIAWGMDDDKSDGKTIVIERSYGHTTH